MTSRSIAAIPLPEVVPGTPPTKAPEIAWFDPTELLVDESYQRGIGDKGLKLIRKIVETFDWRRFKPPTAVWTENGLEVIDGQHSAIAAATHPGISSIPVVIVEAELVSDRADAFLGMNRDRLAISAMQLHAAAVVAGDHDALAIDRICAACGVTVLRMPRAGGVSRPKDTLAVKALGDLVRRVGEDLATVILRTLAEAGMAPITASALRAAEVLLVGEEFDGQVDPARLTRAIVTLGAEADKEAGVFAGTHHVPRWRGLVAVWFQELRTRKRRPEGETGAPCEGAGSAPSDKAASPKLPSRRVILRPVLPSSVNLGDPPPGRSALDRQRVGRA